MTDTISMEDRDGWIWLDGALVPWRDARVHILSYTFQHGAGVFEGLRCYDGNGGAAIFRLHDHSRRLFESAHMLGMEIPFTVEQIEQAQCAVAEANGGGDCYLRPVVYFDGQTVGVSAQGNGVHLAIASWPWPSYMAPEAQSCGIRVQTSSFSRLHPGSVLLKAKVTGHYVNAMLAIGIAKRQGFDDALMLDANGLVAECTTSNVFILRDDVLITPPSTYVLEGVTRDTIQKLAEREGIATRIASFGRDEVYRADEAFVTGTAAEVVPMVELDGRKIGEGIPGPVTRKLMALYADAVRGKLAGAPPEWRSLLDEKR
jgi:branched-chain amino acid aminotransferase